jgi:CTP-dependent riboflavin kinase
MSTKKTKLSKNDLRLMAVRLMMQQIDSCNYILGDDDDGDYVDMSEAETRVMYDEFKKEYRKLLVASAKLVLKGAVEPK